MNSNGTAEAVPFPTPGVGPGLWPGQAEQSSAASGRAHL